MSEPLISLDAVTHTYTPGTSFAVTALDKVSLTIHKGEFVGLIGPTGSGKSTLVQHLNGLLKPTSGHVRLEGRDIWEKGVSLKQVRQRIGLVFQYPEHQLFDETVAADVAFGPRNAGLTGQAVEDRVTEALALVGLGGALADRSPFALSGGQMRRAALAGVLAMRPEVLVLDEPASGLDPRGRDEILGHVLGLHRLGLTVVLVSHNMEDIARLATRIIVMHQGRVLMDGTPREVFARTDELEAVGLSAPPMTLLARELRQRGLDVPLDLISVEEGFNAVLKALGKEGRHDA